MKKIIDFPAPTLTVLVVMMFTMGFAFARPSVAQDRHSFWVGVQNAGINSHQPGPAWCPEGSFLVALDLDGPRNFSAHDSPIVGQAMCANSAGRAMGRWGSCFWVGVETAGINSHQPGKAWCPEGTYLVALDLDGPRNYSAHDSPVVGQAMCCSPP